MRPVPVFLTTGADSMFVGGIAASLVDYWMRHQEASPVTVLDWGADPRWWNGMLAWGYMANGGTKLRRFLLHADTSQRMRHVVALGAAQRMKAEWFVQTDDDILPRAEFSPHAAVEILRSACTTQPAFGMPAGTPYGLVQVKLPPCNLPHAGTPDGEYPVIREAGAVGGLRFISTALDPDGLPPYDPQKRGYDPLLCDAVREQGLAVGAFWDAAPLGLRATHLRREYSTVWPNLSLPDTLPREGARGA